MFARERTHRDSSQGESSDLLTRQPRRRVGGPLPDPTGPLGTPPRKEGGKGSQGRSRRLSCLGFAPKSARSEPKPRPVVGAPCAEICVRCVCYAGKHAHLDLGRAGDVSAPVQTHSRPHVPYRGAARVRIVYCRGCLLQNSIKDSHRLPHVLWIPNRLSLGSDTDFDGQSIRC